MKAETPNLIPDVDPSGGIIYIDPLVYGGRCQERKPLTISVLRKNAGRMPAGDIAAAMGWSLTRLRRIAAQERIDLSFPRVKELEPRGA